MASTDATPSRLPSVRSAPETARHGRPSSERSPTDRQSFVVSVDIEALDGYERLYGAELRDQVLEHVFARIAAQLRRNDVVQPWPGHGFTAILAGGSSLHDARAVADRLAHSIRDPVVVHGHSLLVIAPVAVTESQVDGLRVEVPDDTALRLP